MPTATFAITPVLPGAFLGENIKPNDNIIYSLYPVDDPDTPGAVRIPDLNTIRQSGSPLIKQYTNVAALADGNGAISEAQRPNLTGGYFSLRYFNVVGGTKVYSTTLIPCAVGWASGYGPDNYVSISADSELRLVIDPRPGNDIVAMLDSNVGGAQALPNPVLPYITVGGIGGGSE